MFFTDSRNFFRLKNIFDTLGISYSVMERYHVAILYERDELQEILITEVTSSFVQIEILKLKYVLYRSAHLITEVYTSCFDKDKLMCALKNYSSCTIKMKYKCNMCTICKFFSNKNNYVPYFEFTNLEMRFLSFNIYS